MLRALLKIRIKVYEKADLFVLFAISKSNPFLELKPRCSVEYRTIVLCLFSKQTDKVENFWMSF